MRESLAGDRRRASVGRIPDQAQCEYESTKSVRVEHPGLVRQKPVDTGCIHLYNLEMRKHACALTGAECFQCAEDQRRLHNENRCCTMFSGCVCVGTGGNGGVSGDPG